MLSRHKPFQSDVEGAYLVQFASDPCALLAVPPGKPALVAVLAEGNAGVVKALGDVVRIAWSWLVAHAAWERLYAAKVGMLGCCDGFGVLCSHRRNPRSCMKSIGSFADFRKLHDGHSN